MTAPPPDDDFEVRTLHYSDGSTREQVRRRSDGKIVSERTPAAIRGQHPQVVIMDEAGFGRPPINTETGEIIDLYDAGGIYYTPLVIPGVGWFWKCGACHAVVGDGGPDRNNAPDPVSAHAHTQGAHPQSANNKTGAMLTMDRGDLAAAILDWANEPGDDDVHVLADLIRDTNWPYGD